MAFEVAAWLIVAAAPTYGAETAGGQDVGQGARDATPFLPDVFSYRLAYRPQIDLNGKWAFRRDPDGHGTNEGWHTGAGSFADTVVVPGAPQAQGFGKPTAKQKTAFLEPYWMRRTFRCPKLRPDERLWLRIGGILPAAEVYTNGARVGFTKSSRTQQRVDITRHVRPETDNLIAIKVRDFPEVRMCGLLEWNEGTATWSGAYRPIYCEVAHRVSVVDLYAQPTLSAGSVHVTVDLTEASDEPLRLVAEVKDGDRAIGQSTVMVPAGKTRAEAEVKLGDFEPWSPDHPKLYRLEVSLEREGNAAEIDKVGVRFGMREMRVEGTKFFLNGEPIFLNVYGEDHYYPETLCPPWDIDWYRPRLKRARAYGMNGTKGCVETITQDYLEAADEAGIMVIQEMPFGLSTLRANRYTIDEPFREYYSDELDGLVRVSRNHASAVAYSMSSELEFSKQTQASFDFFSRQLPQQTRQLAPHALVIDCTGYVTTEATKKGKRVTDFYASIHPKWMKDVLDEADMPTDGKHPTILHEYNWWSCYPDPADRDKHVSMQLKPFWLDTLERTAWANGQGELIRTYRKNSLWLQTLARKDGIEYARRNPGVEGYILWLLVDFGHWSEGLLDDFWDPKNVSPAEFLKSNGQTVILLAKEGDRCLTMGEQAEIPLAVSHYGAPNLDDAVLRWTVAGGPAQAAGELQLAQVVPGAFTQAGAARFALPPAPKAYKIELRTTLHKDGTLINSNDWSFWTFPEAASELRGAAGPGAAGKTISGGVFLRLGAARSAVIAEDTPLVVADAVDDALVEYVSAGGACLLSSRGAVIENTAKFYGIFRTIPWNAGTSGNSGTVISHHPAMAAFPHEGVCDLPFLHMLKGYLPMEFSPLRQYGVAPIIRGIDHYLANRNNAYLLEFRVGNGKVLVTSLGVLPNLAKRIEVRHLFGSLLNYTQSPRFAPVADVPRDVFQRLFSPRPKTDAVKKTP